VKRTDLQRLAELRVKEAEALLKANLSDGAYYLAGYAVEFALKACIAKQIQAEDVPDKRFILDFHTHTIEDLVRLVGLTAERDRDAKADKDLADKWQLVKDWREDSRYKYHTQAAAQALFDAVTDTTHGVLQWIKPRW
jgi:hypothetical protein